MSSPSVDVEAGARGGRFECVTSCSTMPALVSSSESGEVTPRRSEGRCHVLGQYPETLHESV